MSNHELLHVDLKRLSRSSPAQARPKLGSVKKLFKQFYLTRVRAQEDLIEFLSSATRICAHRIEKRQFLRTCRGHGDRPPLGSDAFEQPGRRRCDASKRTRLM